MATLIDIIYDENDPSSASFVPTEEHVNINGVVHGGVLFFLCDDLIGHYVTAQGLKGAAADSNMHFYRPATVGKRLTARVNERKTGKRLGTYLIDIKDEDGRLIADVMFTVAFL
ncbi:MAG: hotdog fold thioesterase [Clostridiales bacterium]|nr:hotdog fold thioesterase [Clostridiales bacterium]